MNRFFRSVVVATTLIAALGVTVGIAPANAIPITYTFSGIATGTLGGTSFTNTDFAFNVVTDTDLINEVDPENFESPQIFNVAFTVEGIGGTLNFPVGVFGTSNDNFVSFIDYTDLDNPVSMLSVNDPSFGVYDFRSAFGPVTNSDEPNSDINSRLTSEGELTFTDVSSVTFQAVTGAATVPEVSTFALSLPAIVMIGTIVLRRRKLVA